MSSLCKRRLGWMWRSNRDKTTGEGEWGRVNIKDIYIYKKKLCKIHA